MVQKRYTLEKIIASTDANIRIGDVETEFASGWTQTGYYIKVVYVRANGDPAEGDDWVNEIQEYDTKEDRQDAVDRIVAWSSARTLESIVDENTAEYSDWVEGYID